MDDITDLDASTGIAAMLPGVTNTDLGLTFKAVVAYMGYFGSRYVGNDIQLLCGNILDTVIGKTFTMFCIMMQATGYNLKVATVMTFVALLVQYLASSVSECRPYRDKLDGKKQVEIRNTVWVTEKGVDGLNIKPGTVKY